MQARLDWYRSFVETASQGSVSLAARKLYMTQPAVSQALRQLETELGVRLFTRTPRGVVLTAEGSELYGYARMALGLLETGELKLREASSLERGELRLGVGDTALKGYLLPYLDAFHAAHPGVRLRIVNGTTPELAELLKGGAIDLALCNLPLGDDALETVPCLEVRDVFVCAPRMLSSLAQPLGLESVSRLPLVLLETRSNSRRYVDAFFLRHGIVLEPEIELGSHDLLVSFAAIGLGAACVVREFAQSALAEGTVQELQLSEPLPPRHLGFCRVRGVAPPAAAARFMDAVLAGP